MPDVILTVNGQKHGGWLDLRATSSLGQLSGAYRLGLTERWPGQPEKRGIKPGDSCTLHLGSELIITGWVDRLEIQYSDKDHELTVIGRDRTCDLVDCGHLSDVIKWQDKTLMQITAELLEPFGLAAVLMDAKEGGPFKEIAYTPGDSVMSLIRKLCRMRGLIPTSFGDGALVLTGPGKVRAPAALKLGQNIKTGRLSLDHSSRFSIYQARGQSKPETKKPVYNFFNSGEEAAVQQENRDKLAASQAQAAPLATATDPEITRHRPLVLIAEAPGDLAAMELRAGWEKASRAGRSRRAAYTVAGWEARAGRLWRINQLVRVSDEYLGIDEDLLIESVTYTLDEASGSTTSLGLVHPDAYKPEPPELIQAQANKKKQKQTYDFFLKD